MPFSLKYFSAPGWNGIGERSCTWCDFRTVCGPDEFERVFAPMGLEIGALSPEEIAISIVAELIAVRRNAALASHKKIAIDSRTTTAVR